MKYHTLDSVIHMSVFNIITTDMRVEIELLLNTSTFQERLHNNISIKVLRDIYLTAFLNIEVKFHSENTS